MKIYDMLREAEETAPPGSSFSYNNGSTETLAWIIRTITGKSLAENVSERIWSQIGMEENAYYVTDETKVEQASAGLNATARYGEIRAITIKQREYNGKHILLLLLQKV